MLRVQQPVPCLLPSNDSFAKLFRSSGCTSVREERTTYLHHLNKLNKITGDRKENKRLCRLSVCQFNDAKGTTVAVCWCWRWQGRAGGSSDWETVSSQPRERPSRDVEAKHWETEQSGRGESSCLCVTVTNGLQVHVRGGRLWKEYRGETKSGDWPTYSHADSQLAHSPNQNQKQPKILIHSASAEKALMV